jgi:hypothetical protein
MEIMVYDAAKCGIPATTHCILYGGSMRETATCEKAHDYWD